MNPLQYINKILCTLSTLCCGQILYSQIPKESTFPLEIAELIGLKMCDDYTLSYFVMNVSNDGYNSYNHGIIGRNQGEKSTQSTRIIENFFSDFHNKKDGYKPSIDRFLRIDSIYPSQPKKKYQIHVEEVKVEYSDMISNFDSLSKQEVSKKTVVEVTRDNQAVEKHWKNRDGDQMINTIIFYDGKKISDITENVTTKTKKSVNYNYNTEELLNKVEYYKWSNTDSIPSLLNTFRYTYDEKSKLREISSESLREKYSISYIDNDKIRVYGINYVNHSRYEEGSLVEYFLDSKGYISAYKYFKIITETYSGGQEGDGDQRVVTVKSTSNYELICHGIIMCK